MGTGARTARWILLSGFFVTLTGVWACEADEPDEAEAVQEELPPEFEMPAEVALRTHEVRPGETLTMIARQYYGRAEGWRRIYEANRDVITDPNVLRVGMTLEIPPEEEGERGAAEPPSGGSSP